MLVEVLRDQLQQAQQEKARLLAMLEAEQQARRDLETKLLPAPRPAPAGKPRLWVLVILLLLALAFASRYFRDGITFPWPF
jgi:cytochrome c-type biogenesis protein CcmH/NrfG